MAGRSASSTLTRYAGIQVQTSALGLNVPVGWGTFRCKCNLVDYLDFKSKSQKAAASKGGTTTGYTYSATVILALCEGPIDAVSTIYVDGKVYKNGAKTALSQANLNLNTGAIGQPVWSYLTSNHAAHAIGYSGLAIAYQSNYALDSSAQTPNHSFEVARIAGFGVSGTPDADPSAVVADFFTNPRYGVPSWGAGLLGDLTQFQDYCLAAGLLVSPVIDAQRSASDFLTELLRATNSTCVWSEGVLKFIPYGDTALSGHGRNYAPNNTPVYSLNDDDYIPKSDGDDPLSIDIQDQSDAYNVIQLEYLDRTNEYNMAIALASDAANVAQYGMRRKDPDTVHCICDPGVAAISAQLYLQRTLYIRSQFKFTLGWQFALLEPGDILELTDAGLGLHACPVRIIQIDDDEDACRAVIAEDFPVGVAHAPLYAMQTGAGASRDTNIDPGGVEANLLLWSDDATNGVWGKSLCSITGAAANDQYGLPTAGYIVPAASSGGHYIYQGVPAFAGVNYTYSICLQQGAHRYVQLQLSDFIANGAEVEVDLNAGVILSYAAFGNGVLAAPPTIAQSPTNAAIWVVTITCAFPTLPGGNDIFAVCTVLDASLNFTWTGDGSNAVLVSQQAVRQGIASGIYAATTTAIAGPVLFNPPSVLNDGGSQVFAAVAGGPNWGGCNVWTSIDGTNYALAGQVDQPARFGSLTAGFASHADPDTADTLCVDISPSGGQLTGASTSAADNGATLCLVDAELISFETATLTNPSRYSISAYIRRGFMNSPIEAHLSGAPFVRMDSAIFDFPFMAVNVGQTLYVKFQSFNIYGAALSSLTDCIAYSVVPRPVAAIAPSASAWACAGTTIANMGAAVPALQITGACDNAAAASLVFYYRVSGTSPWSSAGAHSAATTLYDIAPVASGQNYDIAVSYFINGVETARTVIGSMIMAGAFNPGATSSTVADGTVLFDSSVTGAWSYSFGSTSLTHAWLELWAADGGPVYKITHIPGEPDTDDDKESAGSGAYGKHYAAVTPGTTTWAGSIGGAGSAEPVASAPGSDGGNTTCTTLGLSVDGGDGATSTASGTGGTLPTGFSITNTAGTSGAVPDSIGPNNGRVRITAKT